MPSLNHLNPPPHPFWDFVAGLDDHPFFAAYSQPHGQDQTPAGGSNVNPGPAPANQEPSETARGKQPTVEDPPEADPSTVHPGATTGEEARGFPFRGGRRAAGEGHRGRGGHACRGRGGTRGRGGPFGHAGFPPSPFGFGPPPFWAGPRHHSRHNRHHHGPPQPEGDSRQPGGEQGFDLGQFLNNLGGRLGVDLTGAAENLGLNNYSAPRTNDDADFEPRTDIFDTASHYAIHLSLPGAKKEDVGVDWDGEHSVLRITGVVHRPGVDEEMLARLVVDGRKRENGVFEKAIRLGTKRDPASVSVGGITAKMADGVLIVTVPKVEKKVEKREVHVSGSDSPTHANEKDLLFDADEEMYDAVAQTPIERAPAPASALEKQEKSAVTEKSKAEEARDDRSETAAQEEPLPRYQAEDEAHSSEDDWEKDLDEEGDFVKINVN